MYNNNTASQLFPNFKSSFIQVESRLFELIVTAGRCGHCFLSQSEDELLWGQCFPWVSGLCWVRSPLTSSTRSSRVSVSFALWVGELVQHSLCSPGWVTRVMWLYPNQSGFDHDLRGVKHLSDDKHVAAAGESDLKDHNNNKNRIKDKFWVQNKLPNVFWFV